MPVDIKENEAPHNIIVPIANWMEVGPAAKEVYKVEPDGTTTPWEGAVSQNTVTGHIENAIINGDFNFWQRGTSFPTIGVSFSDDNYCADHWHRRQTTSAGSFTVTRSTDVPTASEHRSEFSMVMTIDSPGPAAAQQRNYMSHPIEGIFFSNLFGKVVEVSFWVKSSRAGIFCVHAANSSFSPGATPLLSYVTEFTINAADTWEKKTVFIDWDTTGTWFFDTQKGGEIGFPINIGPADRNIPDTWLNDRFFCTDNQTDLPDVGDYFQVSQVEARPVGNTLTSFRARRYGEELALCQRYYEKTLPVDIDPIDGSVLVGALDIASQPGSVTDLGTFWKFEQEKRIIPTVLAHTPISATPVANWRASNGTFIASVLTPSTRGILATSTIATTANVRYEIHLSADADF